MALTKVFSPKQYEEALESWSWLDLSGMTPVLSNRFGDSVLSTDEGYWFLDVIGGHLDTVWADRDEMDVALSTEQGREKWLLAGLAIAAEEAGVSSRRRRSTTLRSHPC